RGSAPSLPRLSQRRYRVDAPGGRDESAASTRDRSAHAEPDQPALAESPSRPAQSGGERPQPGLLPLRRRAHPRHGGRTASLHAFDHGGDGVSGGDRSPARQRGTPSITMSVEAHPKISIILPTLNAEALLDNCLASVAAQTWPRDRLEVLLAD